MWSEYLRRIVAQCVAGQQVVFIRPEMQDHIGAARLLADRLDGVAALARAFPSDARVGCGAGAAGHERHALGDDERGVETDAELADEMRVPGLSAVSVWKNSRVPDLAIVPI